MSRSDEGAGGSATAADLSDEGSVVDLSAGAATRAAGDGPAGAAASVPGQEPGDWTERLVQMFEGVDREQVEVILTLTDNNIEETIELLEENGAKLKTHGAVFEPPVDRKAAEGKKPDTQPEVDPPQLGLVEAVPVSPTSASALALSAQVLGIQSQPRPALAVRPNQSGSVGSNQLSKLNQIKDMRGSPVEASPLLLARTRESTRRSKSAATIGARSAKQPVQPKRKLQRTTRAASSASKSADQRQPGGQLDIRSVTDVPSNMLGKRVVCLFIIKKRPVWYGGLVTQVPEQHHQAWPFLTVKVDDGDKQHVLIRESNKVQDERIATVATNPKAHAPCGGVWYLEAEGEWRDDSVFFVERILDKRRGANGEIEYLVKWWSYSVDESTWEPHKNCMEDSAVAVKEFEAAQVRLPVFSLAVRNCCCLILL